MRCAKFSFSFILAAALLSGCRVFIADRESYGSIRAVCESAYAWNISESNPGEFRADLIPTKLSEAPHIFSDNLKDKLLQVYHLNQEYVKNRKERFGGLAYGNFGLTMLRLNLPLKSRLSRDPKWSTPKISGAFATIQLKDMKTYAAGPNSVTTQRSLRFHLERQNALWSVCNVEIKDSVLNTNLVKVLTETLVLLESDVHSMMK
jgi:hypothetical protein